MMNFHNPGPLGAIPANLAPLTNLRETETERLPLIRQYLRIALRWRYVIIGATAVGLLLGLIGTLLMTPKYTATTTIEISRESNKVTDFQGVEREAGVADQEFSRHGLLRSRTLSERIACQLRLVNEPYREPDSIASPQPHRSQLRLPG